MGGPRLSAIGLGAVGLTLARRWVAAGLVDVAQVATASLDSARDAVRRLGQGTAAPPDELAGWADSDAIMLAVPESALAEWIGRLGAVDLPAGRTCILFHTSGAVDSGVLRPLHGRGFRIASAHPLAAFQRDGELEPGGDPPVCCIEGDAEAVAFLIPLFEGAGFRPLELPPVDRALYHAAVVFSANFIPALVDASLRLYRAVGIDEATARRMLAPIVADVARKALADGPQSALAGPLVRGELAVVSGHIEAIARESPDDLELYRALARATLPLAVRKSGMPDAVRRQFEALLRDD